jgi:hypothetical protein
MTSLIWAARIIEPALLRRGILAGAAISEISAMIYLRAAHASKRIQEAT